MFEDGLAKLARQTDVLMALGMIGLVGMMVIPLPPALLDLLLTLNIAGSLCTLLVSTYIQKPSTSPSSRPCCSSRLCTAWR